MYIVHRIEKYHTVEGITEHINRTGDGEYINNIDPSKSDQNINFKPDKQWTSKDIKEQYKARKNAVLGIEGIYTASPEFFKDKTEQEIKQFFRDCVKFHKEHYGQEIIAASIHMDETTPHLHIVTIPLYNGKLNARHYTDGSKMMSTIQTDIYNEIGKKWGLDRGEYNSRQAHKDTITSIKKKLAIKYNELDKWEKSLEQRQNEIDNMTIEQAKKILSQIQDIER